MERGTVRAGLALLNASLDTNSSFLTVTQSMTARLAQSLCGQVSHDTNSCDIFETIPIGSWPIGIVSGAECLLAI